MVHHRGRRVVAALAAGRLARPVRGRDVWPRHHAADLRGAQGPALSVVLRRHPDPAYALALDDPRPGEPGEPPGFRPALVLPGRGAAVVRGPAGPAVLDLPAGRGVQPGHRRRPALPEADHLPSLGRAGDGPARPGAGGGPAAAR